MCCGVWGHTRGQQDVLHALQVGGEVIWACGTHTALMGQDTILDLCTVP